MATPHPRAPLRPLLYLWPPHFPVGWTHSNIFLSFGNYCVKLSDKPLRFIAGTVGPKTDGH